MNDKHNDYTDILIAEDNPNDAELATRGLARSKVANKVVLTKDGQLALDYLFGQGEYEGRDTTLQPKVVLLDLKLPKLNGLEVLERMRKDPRTKLTPVVILTSSQEESDLVRSYHLGANSYIVKPVDFEKFTEAIREIGLYWMLLNKVPTTPKT